MAKQQATKPVETNAEPSDLPLFYTAPRVVTLESHQKATIASEPNYSFARSTNSAPLNAIEFAEALKYYPIVFSGGEQATPAVVLGFENENYYVNADGKWRNDYYIPAYARQYPFIFFEQPSEERFYLCVDEQAASFSATGENGGNALFTEDGAASPLSNNALEFCTAYYQQHAVTKNFCADLVKHDLLSPFQTELKLNSGRTLKLGGFQIIDEAKFNALPADVFADFRSKGWLPFIYFAFASMSNWRRLADNAA